MLKRLSILLATGLLAQATTTIKVPKVSATQAIVFITTDTGAASGCIVRANEGTSLGAPYVNDVNTTLFAGSNLASRPGSVSVGGVYKFVLGSRTAPVSPSDN